MIKKRNSKTTILIIIFSLSLNLFAEKRNEVSYLRGPYNYDFFYRNNESYDMSSAIHFAHGYQHDILEKTPLSRHQPVDDETYAKYLDYLYNPPKTEPTMEYFGPYIARSMWQLYRAIDWTHMHHEQTYDIMSYQKIPWPDKKEWTDRSVRYYLDKFDIPRSIAPLDITMRRAGVMMKPYTTYFRNNYPKSNNYFYFAHWWHPIAYEAQMIGGNDSQQVAALTDVDKLGKTIVVNDPPLRMLLSREVMPRYSRMSPESGNIFDNLHMLHGIAYDILAYEGWTIEEKKKELYRVINAMAYHPGDEKYVRKFQLPHPDVDPRVYEPWMKTVEGDMNRMMREMMMEMMPLMMDVNSMSAQMHQKAMDQFMLKLTPGIQEGEFEGSISDAMKKVMPNMKMDEKSMSPGATPQKMIDAMLQGWHEKYGNLPDVEPIDMQNEPSLPPKQENRE
ncbi:MAG: hypothetical protein A2Y10_14600 [Planctomycetes bacterium GWF2_41_51]|nr:MAG: hypothetical protein A2Y10_14600 [Planctomycetes bacterium GWF2_41_51]HBG25491.1 hypothetical protein [Phycisphaerales bacterium]